MAFYSRTLIMTSRSGVLSSHSNYDTSHPVDDGVLSSHSNYDRSKWRSILVL